MSDVGSIPALELKLLRDDGAVVYLNGNQVASSNMPVRHDRLHDAGLDRRVRLGRDLLFTFAALPDARSSTATNVIAVEVHQNVASSTDVSFNASLQVTGGARGRARARALHPERDADERRDALAHDRQRHDARQVGALGRGITNPAIFTCNRSTSRGPAPSTWCRSRACPPRRRSSTRSARPPRRSPAATPITSSTCPPSPASGGRSASG